MWLPDPRHAAVVFALLVGWYGSHVTGYWLVGVMAVAGYLFLASVVFAVGRELLAPARQVQPPALPDGARPNLRVVQGGGAVPDHHRGVGA